MSSGAAYPERARAPRALAVAGSILLGAGAVSVVSGVLLRDSLPRWRLLIGLAALLGVLALGCLAIALMLALVDRFDRRRAGPRPAAGGVADGEPPPEEWLDPLRAGGGLARGPRPVIAGRDTPNGTRPPIWEPAGPPPGAAYPAQPYPGPPGGPHPATANGLTHPASAPPGPAALGTPPHGLGTPVAPPPGQPGGSARRWPRTASLEAG